MRETVAQRDGSRRVWVALALLVGMGGVLAGSSWMSSALAQPAGPGSDAARTAAVRKRPVLSPEAYAAEVQKLRALYQRPPEQWPAPTVDASVEHRELGLLPDPPHPESNPYSKPKADLGRMLFFDPRLSGSGQMACVSCHDADLGWTDGLTVAMGNAVSPQKRNTPSLLNAAYLASLFWDGRAASLEEQALAPIANPDEMHSTPAAAAARIGAVEGYGPLFEAAFGTPEVTPDRIAMALATFQRTLVAGRSRFDAFLRGRHEAMSDSAIRGLHLFRTDARCINCHNGPEFTNNQFHDLGLSYYGRAFEDLGRYEITRRPEDVGRFRTPPLRNVTRTAPYMHNGLFDLAGVLNMYNAGMPTLRRKPDQENDPLFPTKDPLLQVLNLNDQDLADLTAFMEALEEPRVRVRRPELP